MKNLAAGLLVQHLKEGAPRMAHPLKLLQVQNCEIPPFIFHPEFPNTA